MPDNTPEQFEQTLVIELHEQDEDFPVAGLYAYHDECPEEGAILLLDHQEGVPAGGDQEDTYETKIAKTLELVKQAADAIQVFTALWEGTTRDLPETAAKEVMSVSPAAMVDDDNDPGLESLDPVSTATAPSVGEKDKTLGTPVTNM